MAEVPDSGWIAELVSIAPSRSGSGDHPRSSSRKICGRLCDGGRSMVLERVFVERGNSTVMENEDYNVSVLKHIIWTKVKEFQHVNDLNLTRIRTAPLRAERLLGWEPPQVAGQKLTLMEPFELAVECQ
ncbi:hypothetical protein Scep_016307 [Stephania cephalantha]|uniref:Uncharacterized protein n=1 Tax=Stephania cephalantha TaxID=152367 RepID=A0AAP0IMD7_9MAGN